MGGGWLRRGVGAAFLPGRYRWWHAAALGIAANLISGVLGRPRGDKAYYEGLKQAPFAPPAGAFGPAWTVNNLSVLWGNLRLLNLPANVPHRRALLGLQAASPPTPPPSPGWGGPSPRPPTRALSSCATWPLLAPRL